MSVADKIIEKYRAGDSGSVADRIIRKFKGPSVQDRAKEARDKAEKYYQEAEDINNSFLVKGADLVNSLVGTTKAVGASAVDMLTPWDKQRTDSVNYKGVEYKTPGGKGAAGGARIAQGDVKGGLGEIGSGLLDVAQFIPVGGAVVRGATKATPIMQTLKGLGSVQGLKTAGIGLLKNKSVQQNAALMGGYGVTDAMQENQGIGGIALSGAKGVGLGAGLGLGFEGAGSLIGRAFTSLFEKIGTRPKRIVPPSEVKETVDEIINETGQVPTPEEEVMLNDLMSNGATKEEAIDAVGMEKMMAPKPSLLEVEMTVEQNIGRQLDLEEKMTLKTDIDSGKPVEEIVQGFTTPKAPVEAPKDAATVTQEPPKPKSDTQVPDNGDDAFLKAVEERFKASKTNKFREATKDEKGRFTGSTRESGDAARDELAESIENRINAIPDNSVENFGYREDLRAIQTKVANAKPAELPALKAQSDRIAQEILDNRAKKIRPIIAKDKKIAFTRTVANESENFNEFQVNLKKRGEDITTIFKSKAAAEEFFNKNSSKPKYRVADEDHLLSEARKYETPEEFVNSKDGEKAFFGRVVDDIKSKLPNNEVRITQNSVGVMKGNVRGGWMDNDDVWTFYPNRAIPEEFRAEVQKRIPGAKVMNSAIDFPKDKFPSINQSQLTDLWKKAQGGKNRLATDQPIPKILADESEAGYQVRAEMENSQAGERIYLGYGSDAEVKGIPSTFPKWVSPEYRSSDLFEKVLKHLDNGTVPKSSRQRGLYEEIREEMARRAGKFGERFEEVSGLKITPEQEAKILALNKKLFGDDNVKITAQLLTPEGQKAFGEYRNKVIKILDGQADPFDTYYHEAVHKYLDLFTTLDEQKKIYVEARKVWKTGNLDELEEQIAENFIRYAKTSEGVTGTLKEMFDKVLNRIRSAIKGESQIEALYKDILSGKAKQVETPKKSSVEPKNTVEKPLVKSDAQVKPKTSVIASRLNEALPEGFKIDESYDPKVIKEEIDKAAQTISKDKEKAIQKAFDPNTNPVERDAILIELSEIAKRDGDFGAVADLFQRRAELIRSGAQSLNMEKASILLNPQEKYMRDIVNSRLSKVKINGKDLTDVEVSAVRKTVRKEASEAAKRAFKIQDAQELFNSLICT